MAFDRVPIGIGDGLPEPRRFRLGRCRVSGCPGLENAPGAVEMLPVPSDRNYFDIPSSLSCHLSMRPMELVNRGWAEKSCASSCSAALVCLPQTGMCQ